MASRIRRRARYLELVNAGSNGRGIYLGGWNIAPDRVLIYGADSWEEAWEALCEHYAELGALTLADDADDLVTPDGCDWVDGHGLMVTADVVMRTVRPTHRD